MVKTRRLYSDTLLPWVTFGLIATSVLLLGYLSAEQLTRADALTIQRSHQLQHLLQLDAFSAQLQHEQQIAHTFPLDRSQFKRAVQGSQSGWQQLQQNTSNLNKADLAGLQILWQRLQTYRQFLDDEPAALSTTETETSAYTALQTHITHIGLDARDTNFSSASALLPLRTLYGRLDVLQASLKALLRQSEEGDEAAYMSVYRQAMAIDLMAEQYQPLLTERQARLFDEVFISSWQPVYHQLQDILSLRDGGGLARQIPGMVQGIQSTRAQLDTLLSDSRDNALRQTERQEASHQALWWLWITGLFLLPGLGAGLMVAHRYRTGLRLAKVLAWVQTMTCGNLTVMPDAHLLGGDAVGRMTQQIDELRHQWRRTLLQIQAQCERLDPRANTSTDWSSTSWTDNGATVVGPVEDPDTVNMTTILADKAVYESALKQQLHTLEHARAELDTLLDGWSNETADLQQQLTHVTRPAYNDLGGIASLIGNVQGLSQWLNTLQAYMHKGEQLVQQAQNCAQQLNTLENEANPDRQQTALQALQTETQQLEIQLKALLEGLQQLTPASQLVTTRLSSHTTTGALPPTAHPLSVLYGLVNQFKF
jgi:hypothetical protein